MLGQNILTWVFECLQKLRCQVLSALDVPCSSFCFEEKRVNVCVCAQYVSSVHMEEIQPETIRFLTAKAGRKLKKYYDF